MELSKIDLSAVKAVGHSDEKLGLLIDKEDNAKYIEVPAPKAAYVGLKQVEALANTEDNCLCSSGSNIDEIGVESEQNPEQYINYCEREYTGTSQTFQMENRDGVVYQYEQTVEVRVRESISVVEEEDCFNERNFSTSYESRFASSSEYLQIQLSDGSVEEYGTYAGELTAIASRGEESSTENIYLSDANYDPESECLRMEFDDGTVYEYEEVSPDFWQDFQKRITED